MAVLKSPRNNKNKKRWSEVYASSLSVRSPVLPNWLSYKGEHKIYKQASFVKMVEKPSPLPQGGPSTQTKNPFITPTLGSPLPCNSHFQNLNNTTRVFHPLILVNVV